MILFRLLANLLTSIAHSETFRYRIAPTYYRLTRRKAARVGRTMTNLNAFEASVYSQNGEDGIIREITSRLPIPRFFVEFGVEDGSICNGRLLAERYNWRGLMLECDERHFPRLEQRYGSLPVACVKAFITRENIAELFAQNAVPTEFGMLSIDVDGNDYWLWEALAAYRPYLVVIEYNGTLGPEVRRVQVYDPLHQWNPRMRSYGASLGALAALGRRLGYALVGTDCRGINAFFVRKDVLGQAGFPELDVSTAFHPHRSYQCFLPYGTNPMLDI